MSNEFCEQCLAFLEYKSLYSNSNISFSDNQEIKITLRKLFLRNISLHEKCPYMEIFLVRIFLYGD